MATFQHSDAPLLDPADDLLDMAPHAQTLASYLKSAPLPFTIGIYGKWGDGKTTYSNLLISYLKEDRDASERKDESPSKDEDESSGKPSVIIFSAWPYITADAIWRALLGEIAGEILGQKERSKKQAEEQYQQAEPAHTETFRRRLSDVMLTGMLTVRRHSATPDEQQYEELRKKFDRSAVIANRTANDGSPSAAVAALAGLVLSAADTLSPGVGALRKVLGIGDGSVREMLAGEQPSASAVVASVEELRKDIKELFKKNHKPLIILLDDLDRCMPQVALDFLETVKVFFFESGDVNAKCLFIVAVDEELIGRGLRMRIGEGQDMDTDAEARAYLEKIVQLRVPVPAPNDRQVRKLIAASFPMWAWTTDLLTLGIGHNPRRIKQQCNLMTYRFVATRQPKANRDEH